jgi:hypothetical protein
LLRFKYKNKKFKNTKSGFVYVIKNWKPLTVW